MYGKKGTTWALGQFLMGTLRSWLNDDHLVEPCLETRRRQGGADEHRRCWCLCERNHRVSDSSRMGKPHCAWGGASQSRNVVRSYVLRLSFLRGHFSSWYGGDFLLCNLAKHLLGFLILFENSLAWGRRDDTAGQGPTQGHQHCAQGVCWCRAAALQQPGASSKVKRCKNIWAVNRFYFTFTCVKLEGIPKRMPSSKRYSFWYFCKLRMAMPYQWVPLCLVAVCLWAPASLKSEALQSMYQRPALRITCWIVYPTACVWSQCIVKSISSLVGPPVAMREVDMDLCTQCNKCSLICPHAAAALIEIWQTTEELVGTKSWLRCALSWPHR